MHRNIKAALAAVGATAVLSAGAVAVFGMPDTDHMPVQIRGAVEYADAARDQLDSEPKTPEQIARAAVKRDFQTGMRAVIDGKANCTLYMPEKAVIGLALIGGCKGLAAMVADEAQRNGVPMGHVKNAIDDAKVTWINPQLTQARVQTWANNKPKTMTMDKDPSADGRWRINIA